MEQPTGIVVEEYQGVPVLTTPPKLTFEQVRDTANWPKGFRPIRITREDALKPGMAVLVADLGGGYALYVVESTGEGLGGRSGEMVAFFEFGQDDRQCWICTGVANLKGLERLEIQQ
jgi:hypothetical protein